MSTVIGGLPGVGRSRLERRRVALIGAVALVAITFASQGVIARDEPATGVLVAVGDVTDTTAVLWLRAPTAHPVRVTIASGRAAARTVSVAPSPARDLTGRVTLDGLAPATRYEYRVDTAGGAVTGRFLTAPPLDEAAPVRLVWSADLGARVLPPRRQRVHDLRRHGRT